ncbi:hypothetical protein N7512_005888 [Penicillium capsulatum]|nr:hypothetical protein N7512_005888 [Penicillium capsulatum]
MKHSKVSSVCLELDSEKRTTTNDKGKLRPIPPGADHDVLPVMAVGSKAARNPVIENLSGAASHAAQGRQALNLKNQSLVEGAREFKDSARQKPGVQPCQTATEHAILDSRQLVSISFNGQSVRKQFHIQRNTEKPQWTNHEASQIMNKIDANGQRLLLDKIHEVPHDNTGDVKPTKKHSNFQTSNPSQQENHLLVSSRPRRSRKAHHAFKPQTEVHWSEDIRPTPNDEALKADSDGHGTSVSTPSAGYISVFDKKSAQKRKRPKSQSSSEKRRKPGKRDDTGAVEQDQQVPQLPLTTNSECLPTYHPASCSRPESKSHDRPGEKPGNNSGTTTGRPSEGTEVIEISSRVSLSSASCTSDDDLDKIGSQTQQTSKVSHEGRGKAVGQKLFDALREFGLHSQLTPVVEPKSHPGSIEATTYHESSSIKTNHARVQSAPVSSSRDLSIPMAEPKKRSGQPGEQKPIAPSLGKIGPPDSQQPTVDTGASKGIGNNIRKRSPETQGTTDHQQIPDSEINQSLNEPASTHYIQQSYVPEPSTNPASRQDTQKSSPPKAFEIAEAHKKSSSPSSGEARILSHAEWLSQIRGIEQTPESQRPLLTHKSPISRGLSQMRNFNRIPLNTIVDLDGSPRLAAHSGAHPMGSQDSTETSIGNYPSNSSGSSLDSSSEDRRTWTKFQRDMFQEYGITAQELASAPDRLGFPCNHAQAHNVSAGTVLVRKKLDSWDGPVTMGPPRVNGTSMVEKDTSNLNATVRAKSTVFSPKGEYQQLSSTEIHDADLSMRESHQGSSNPMDWILALQAAQKSAHGLLQDTNQVSGIPSLALEIYSVHRICRPNWPPSKRRFARCSKSTGKDVIAFWMICSRPKKSEWSCTDGR